MSDWNFLISACVTIGAFYSNVHHQFLQEKLLRFRVEFMVRMRKHITWNSHWELSVQGTHLNGGDSDSSLQTAQQLKWWLLYPENAPPTGLQNHSWLFTCQIFLVNIIKHSVEKVRGTESMSTVRTTTRDVQKRFKPGLQWVNHLYIMRYLQQETLGENNSVI